MDAWFFLIVLPVALSIVVLLLWGAGLYGLLALFGVGSKQPKNSDLPAAKAWMELQEERAERARNQNAERERRVRSYGGGPPV